uniref:Cyclic nucleotide-binding domain-containing protein n=1 Tax=Alexandrium monilatum TaxID=311494 RepID=A0A7S4QXH1_9DINO
MDARTPPSAVYDEYLEAKMRVVLEALVEALLLEKPEDVEGFCADWLERWHRDHSADHEDLERLRAERDLWLDRRNSLLAQLSLGSRAGSPPPVSRSASAMSRSYSESPTRRDRFDTADEEGGTPISAAEEAREQEMILRMKGKDRRAGVSAQTITAERLKDWKAPFHEKPAEARARIKRKIDESEKLQVLFGHLRDQSVNGVIDAMFPREVRSGENVITQGEEGDNFYIVDEGTFEAFVQRGDAPPAKVCEYGPGGMFGELALMYNAMRAATVTATSDAKLWALDRDSFQMMLTTAENTKKKQYEEFLENVEILQDLTKYERARLSDMLESQCFDPGEAIINQGEVGSYFFILEDGEAKAFLGGEHGEIEVKHYREPGEFFGEIALLKSATRKATVRAVGEGCSVLSVNRHDFDLVLGPIKDILGKNIGKYPQYADFIREENENEEMERAEQEKIGQMKDSNRRAGVSAPAISEERMKEWKAPFYEKGPDTRQKIKQIIETNEKLQVLFGHLTDRAVFDVIDAMFPQSCEAGANLITQGEVGDNFYIIDEGTFDVYVQRGSNPPGKVLEYGPGAMFGELALMYNAPRAATVRATSRSRLWALDRESFQMMLCTAENLKKSRYEEFLANIEIFAHMTKYELARLSDMLETELFEAGEDIVKQGDEGNYFYIIEDGEARAYINGEKGEVEVKHYSKPGEFFGEVSLLTKAARRATVRASSDCSVLSVSRDDFDRVIGPIKDILEANIDMYPNYADIIRDLKGK